MLDLQLPLAQTSPPPTLPFDPRRCCRFCLQDSRTLSTIPFDQLQQTDIPHLYEIVTNLQLDLRPFRGYSQWMCTVCEQQLRTVARIRDDFVRAANRWVEILAEHDKIPNDNEFDATANSNANNDMDPDKSGERSERFEHNYIDFGDNDAANIEDPPLSLNPPLSCDICAARLTTVHQMRRHMRTEHTTKQAAARTTTAAAGTCYICGKTNLKRLDQHLRDHRKTDRYRCAHCPKAFARLAMKEQHERQHTGDRPYICEVCAFTFTSPAALKRHSRLHTDPHALTLSTSGRVLSDPPQRTQSQHRRPLLPPDAVPPAKLPPRAGIRLECPLCGNTYVNRSSLQPHMKIQHGLAGLEAWKRFLATTCLVCGVKVATAGELTEHKVQHQRHQCGICRRRFQCRVTLELHVLKHSKKERRHKCDLCEMRYACAFALRSHQRRAHTAERPHRCGQCALGFVERWELNAHMKKQHTMLRALRPHRCDECADTFRTLDALRVHREKHAGRFRYQCGVCGRNQHSGPLLVQHMRDYHVAEWRAEEEERLGCGEVAGQEEKLDDEQKIEIKSVVCP